MAQLLDKDPRELIKRFSPLYQIDQKYHSNLASELRLITVEPDEIIIRKSRDPMQMHYLVSGAVEIRESFENRYRVDHRDALCSKTLESALKERSSVKALERCVLLVANAEKIDQYLSWSQDYTIFYLDEGEMSVDAFDLIDDDFQEDWDSVFIRSKLAANLSNRAIHQLLSQLEDIEVAAGECVVRANTPGDFFYVIKQGEAEVLTAAQGPFRGERFPLGPGNYFGDEALVADTIRNASVTMVSDGVLGRLNIEAFNHLIKQYLVSPLEEEIRSHDKVKILDVRLPLEYRHGHVDNSVNMPISMLRQQMQEMKESLLYVITPANDRRTELATYLMRQAGFEAYYLPA